MKQIIYICICVLYGFMTGITAYAQKADVSDAGKEIGKIDDLTPGKTIRPENSENWSPDMFRQWENAIKKVSEEKVKPAPRPVIKTPDFSKMTDEQITAWEDSIVNILYPPMEIFTYNNKETEGIKTLPDEKLTGIGTMAAGFTNTYVPTSVSIDKNKVAGEIPIQSSVKPNGAVSYNVPIDIYPGINGFQPNISLDYSSIGGNGTVGVGWGVGGLSTIFRTTKNHYYNGKSEGVVINKNDAFILDGMHLVKISEDASQINYETERGFIKVTAFLTNNAVRYFKVWYPNGNVGTYGYSNSASAPYLMYPLTQLIDRFNNTITFSYLFEDNHYIITGIRYGNASIVFNYQTLRNDKPFFYMGGRKIPENRLLESIECKYGTSVLRKYSMSYISQKDLSHLSQIDLSSGGSSVNPLRFYYGENNTEYRFLNSQVTLGQYYNFESAGNLRITRGKFAYGTEDDGVIVVPNKPQYFNEKVSSGPFNHSRNRYINYYDGTEKIFLYTELNDGGFIAPQPDFLTEEGFIDIFCANIDGQSEDEVIKINNVRVDNTNEKVIFKVYERGIMGAVLQLSKTRTFTFPTVVKDNDDKRSIHPKFYYTGDFNGDGKMEIFAVSCHNPIGNTSITSKCYLFDLESGAKLFESYVFPYIVDFVGNKQAEPIEAAENTDRLMVMDFDGDGKSDICLINDAGTHIYSFDINGTSYSMRKIASYSDITKAGLKNREIMVGEFNGDGLMDLLVSPPTGGNYTWTFYYSKGNGEFEKVTCSSTYFSRNEPLFLQDVNGDGITDMLKLLGTSLFTYLIKPNKGIQTESAVTVSSNSMVVPVDINSSNRFSRIVTIKSGTATKYTYPRNDTREKLLTGVVNSFGVIEKNHYRQLNESGGETGYFYYKGSPATTYPYRLFHGPFYVTVNREQYYSNQRYSFIDYYYENAIVHNQGLGFCGFQKIKQTDKIRNREFTQIYDPFRLGVLLGEESPMTKVTNTYSVNVQTNRIAKVNLTNRTVQDKLKGVTETSSYGYDTYGNPTSETINFGDNITQTTSSTYHNQTESPYMIGFLTNQTVTVSRNGSSNSKRINISSHNNGLPLTKITYANGNKTSESTYSYYPNGMLKEEITKPYSSTNALTSKFEYDSYGRITKQTDPLGFSTTYTYDPSNGVMTNIKNHKSQTISFGYDPMWRRKSVSYPEGVNETTSYAWSSGAGLYNISSSATGKPGSTVYYDAFGREVRTSVIRFNGVVGHSDKTYDSYGRLQKESLPFTGANASSWNSYAYDSYDRPYTITYASGKRTTYSYSGKEVVTVDNGISSTYKYDAQGNLIAVTDPAGTITYNLRPDGQPSSIVAPGNITTSFGYDGYGRQTSISDPSAGNRTFKYDVAGYLERETDANNRVKSMLYDAYGRLKSKTLPEFTTTYNYNSDGLLESQVSTNGTSRTYDYDSYGRLYKERDNGPDSKWLQKIYSYNNGNLSSVQFTSQSGAIGTESYAYANGHMSEIKLGTTSIWKLNAENALGITTSVTTGTVTRTYSYNAYGIPTGRSAYSSNGGTFQNATYSFDATKGNLTYRKDNNRNRQENFGYDNLNRLTSYAGIGVKYDVKGNITQKNDVGSTFYYNTPNKPYAISGVDAGTNTAIPQRNQSVTYTSFERPASLSENGYIATFTYDGTGSRKKMQISRNGSNQLLRYYLGGRYEYDQSTSVKQKLYVGGDAYNAPAVYVNSGSGWVLYYICRDYLGSITHLVNSNGTVAQETSYDAWGRLRNPADQVVYAPDNEPALFLGRGYTGHEHLTMFGLINMNARLYDPAIGRFLSPDPYVQAPDFSQNFNRYSYAMNNPLIYVDETGEYIGWDDVIAAVVGGVINLGVNIWQGNIKGDFWTTIGKGLAAFGSGAVAGWGALYPEFGGWAWGGATVGATNAWLSGSTGWDIAIGAGVGVVSSYAGGFAGQWGAQYLGGAVINGANISSPVLQGAITGTIGGAVGGYTGGFTSGLIMTGDFREANQAGLNGAKFGAPIGGISGSMSAYKYSVKNNIDPWTGKNIGNNTFYVTPEGVVLPKDVNYQIPDNYVESPYNSKMHNSTAYGEYVNGKFVERIRIDAATPTGTKGPQISHYHLNGGKEHYTPGKYAPAFTIKRK